MGASIPATSPAWDVATSNVLLSPNNALPPICYASSTHCHDTCSGHCLCMCHCQASSRSTPQWRSSRVWVRISTSHSWTLPRYYQEEEDVRL